MPKGGFDHPQEQLESARESHDERQAASICFYGDELQTLCEWFGIVQDMVPQCMEKKDWLLGARLYVCANRRVTDEMREKLK